MKSGKVAQFNLGQFFARLITCVLTILLIAPPQQAFGLTDKQLNELYANGVYYYDPTGGNNNCTNFKTGEYNGETSGELTQAQVEFVVKWHDLAAKLSVEFGIPWETALAQGLLESAAGTSNIAVDKHNFHGINAVDGSAYASAFAYTDDVNGWIGYFHNIARTSVYRSHGAFNQNSQYGNAVTDPYAYLQAVAAAGYASDQSYITKNSNIIAKIIKLAEAQGWESSETLASKNPNMISAASALAGGANPPYERLGAGTTSNPYYFNYTGIDGKGEGGGIVSNGACNTSGNGNLNATALELAWPEHGHGCTPSPAYEAAMKEVGTWDEYKGCSCDRFVATVIRYAGADPNVLKGDTGAQLNYFKQHPELYQEIPNQGNTSNMQPGDIMVLNGHIMMYVQRDDGTEGIASASIGSRTGEFGTGVYFSDHRGSYHIFRFIGSTTSSESSN